MRYALCGLRLCLRPASRIPHTAQRHPETLALLYYHIQTPEQVVFRFELAGLVTRAMAWLIDQVFIWAIVIGMGIGLAQLGNFGVALWLAGMLVVDFGYFTLFELRRHGQTPGKRMLGIRVVSADGAALTGYDVLIRNLLRPIDMMPLAMTLGGIIAQIDPAHRRLGDMAAGTIVVRDFHGAAPTALMRSQQRHNTFASDSTIRGRILARISREERDLIYDLVHRRDELDPGVRDRLFGEAADFFRGRFALPADLEHLSDEQTVTNIALVVQNSDIGIAQAETQVRR